MTFFLKKKNKTKQNKTIYRVNMTLRKHKKTHPLAASLAHFDTLVGFCSTISSENGGGKRMNRNLVADLRSIVPAAIAPPRNDGVEVAPGTCSALCNVNASSIVS
jgi:hypothetical protein